MAADDLMDWIAELRGRLARGELAGLGMIEMNGVALPAERVARILLADLDDEDRTRRRRRTPSAEQRRQARLRDFRRLREQIG